MGISSKLNEGRIYRLLKTAIRMRSLQREQGKVSFDPIETHKQEILFDIQLEAVIRDVDNVDTERVIHAMEKIDR